MGRGVALTLESDNEIKIWNIYESLSRGAPQTPDDLAFFRSQANQPISVTATRSIFGCFRILCDPNDAALIEPYLRMQDSRIVASALWTLCWIGVGERYKNFTLTAVEPGFAWDEFGGAAHGALLAAGYHLKTHRDRDLAQLIVRWATHEDVGDRQYMPGSMPLI